MSAIIDLQKPSQKMAREKCQGTQPSMALRRITLVAKFGIFAISCAIVYLTIRRSRLFFTHMVIWTKNASEPPQEFHWNYPRIIDDPEVMCRHYDIPTFVPWMMKFIKESGPLDCGGHGAVDVRGDTIFIKNATSNAIRCNFSEIYRVDDMNQIHLKSVWMDEGQYKLAYGDAVAVNCTDFSSGRSWGEVHTGVRRSDNIAKQTGRERVPKDALPLNVIIWAFDSATRNNFIRKFNKSWSYMSEHMHGTLMDGYNVLGEMTFTALCPVFTGHTIFWGPHAAYVEDILPGVTLFGKFRKRGYVTSFIEDEQTWGAFQHWGEGFRYEPTDHYTRTYMMEKESVIHFQAPCCFGETCNNVVQNYVRDLWDAYPDKLKLVFSLQGIYSHEDSNRLDMIDHEFLDFLQWLNSPAVKNDTMVIFFSDHGSRVDQMTFTRQGMLELRRPIMYISLPDWMEESWPAPMKNLRENSKRLVTAMDLHETLINLLHFTGADYDTVPPLENLPVGLSMFKPMPKGRTCSMAEVYGHFCACKNVTEVDLEGPEKELLQSLAEAAVRALNKHVQSYLAWCLADNPTYANFVQEVNAIKNNDSLSLKNPDSYHPFCREWKLERIVRASAVLANMPGNVTAAADSSMAERDKLRSDYELSIIAMPGRSQLQATAWLDAFNNNAPTVRPEYISRLDWYAPHVKCVALVCPSVEKWCYC